MSGDTGRADTARLPALPQSPEANHGRRDRRSPLAVAMATAGALAITLAGCGQEQVSPATAPPSSAPMPSEGELGAGWDESPDTPVTPEAELTADDLLALLRLPATATADAESCTPEDLDVELGPGDAATGHRYSTIVAANRSERSCTLHGYPGIGARGEWGSTILLEASQQGRGGIDDPALEQDPPAVMLEPGAQAVAPIEWTGELAGADSERASMLVVQVAAGQAPITVPAVLGEPTAGAIDIGMLTTVRVAWWRAAAGS